MREIDVFGTRYGTEFLNGRWVIFHPGADWKRRQVTDLVVPAFVVTEKDLAQYLADVCHEAATPKYHEVRWID